MPLNSPKISQISPISPAKSNILQYTICVVISCIITFAAITLTGILKGTKGDRGVPGVPGDTIVTNYVDALDVLWNSNNGDNAYRTQFGAEGKYAFIAYMLKRDLSTDPDIENGVINATNWALRSAVDIVACGSDELMEGPGFTQLGGGVVYKIDPTGHGYVITNYHVISKFKKYGVATGRPQAGSLMIGDEIYLRFVGSPKEYKKVKTNGNWVVHEFKYENVPAYVIGGDASYDVAILEFGRPEDKLKTADYFPNNNGKTTMHIQETDTKAMTWLKNRYDLGVLRGISGAKNISGGYANIESVKQIGARVFGTQAIAIGNPLGDDMAVSEGIIGTNFEVIKLSPLDYGRTDNDYNRVYRITNGINSGNSGGGLFAMDGSYIGTVQARMYWDGNDNPVANISYAIPADLTIRIAEQVYYEHHKAEWATAGYDNPIPVKVMECGFVTTTSGESFVELDEKDRLVWTQEILVDTANVLNPISETLSNALKGATFNLNQKIVLTTITIGSESYTVDKPYNLEEMMIEAWGKTTIFTFTQGTGTAKKTFNFTIVS